MKVMIGTSGYSYEDWRGVFYPVQLPKGKMLDYYCQHFSCVEVNSTYYRIPHPAVFARMSEKTPENFEFIVKVHQSTTHERKMDVTAAHQICQAIQPLVDTAKFSGFLAQFPFSFKNTPENREYLKWLKEQFEKYDLFVEFRNWTWTHPELAPFLEKYHLGYVNVDEPRLKGLIEPQEIVIGKLAYVRFHGRNTQDWWKGTNQTRYNYLYNQQELDEWLIGLSRILGKAYKTYIFFNNHPQGRAIQNAKMLIESMKAHIDSLKK
ncbi:MAG: DUF72 domain-containing protein [bacterium]|nr:MAG: DUF72 domain-containing protein [bacterium]